MSPTMMAARRRGPTPCKGGSPLFPDRKLRISPIADPQNWRTRPHHTIPKRIEFQKKYHIDERRQYRSTRLYRVADRNAILDSLPVLGRGLAADDCRAYVLGAATIGR